MIGDLEIDPAARTATVGRQPGHAGSICIGVEDLRRRVLACSYLSYLLHQPLRRHHTSLLRPARLHFETACLHTAPAHRHPHRAADQVRIGELDPGALLPVVVKHLEAGFSQLRVDRLGLGLHRFVSAQRQQVNVERG